MDTIPLHLFDYVTLTRLSILNRSFHSNVRNVLNRTRRNRTKEMYAYLKTVTRSQRSITLINTLSLRDVWDLFMHIASLKNIGEHRYLYTAMPIAAITIQKMTTSSDHQDIFIDSSSVINVKMANRHGYHIFMNSIKHTMFILWLYLEIISKYVHATSLGHGTIDITTWSASNINICKIDVWRKKIFISPKFSLTKDIVSVPINTFFHERANASFIRSITLSLIHSVI